MHNTEVIMQILQSCKNLFHNYFYFLVFVEFYFSFPALLLNPLSQTEVHSLEHDVKTLVLQLDSFRFHDKGTVAINRCLHDTGWHASAHLTPPISIFKFLQNLYFSLFKSLLSVLVFIFEFFDCHDSSSSIMLGFIYMPKTAFPYNF